MRQGIRSHLTYANVMVTILAFIVLGGTTYAATGGNFILGQSNTAGAPTQLSSGTAGNALKVTNTTAHGGVWASGGSVANNAAAVHGQSTAGNGVEGISGKNTASGVYGQNDSTGFGVAGRSTNGTGVLGDSSSGWAFNAFGNATQSRAKGGFVKAMALVSPGGVDPIRQCFNSQLPPGQATSGDCGITYSSSGAGAYNLDFGFRVDDRFASLTPRDDRVFVSAAPTAVPSNKFEVSTYNYFTGGFTYNPFYIIVY
jgi:hypothetical protein